ncbi:MAG: AAA family ATPase, partial [Pirellulales bacterium]
MKINDLNIEGFGVWHNLDLPGISSKLTAFYGANEAGKTTLMQFVRGILYGISPERRQRYLPPQEGGRPGGSMTIDDSGQHFSVMRIADRGPNDMGRVTITSKGNQFSSTDSQNADKPISGDRLLRETLGEVDEQTFNNLFAIGLGEIQRLSTLSGTQAAQSLYRLTSGLDRVSLFDIIQGLRESRHQLIHQIIPQSAAKTTATKPIELRSAQAAPLTALVTQRDRLKARIDELKEQNRQWSQWSVQLEEFDRQIEATEALLNERQHAARTIEIAVGLKTNWRRRAKLSHLIQQHHGATLLPENAIDRLETYQEKIAGHQREADILQGQRSQLSDEIENLDINQHLVQHASRIEALGEQRDWLQALERQAERLTEEAEESQQRLTSEQARLSSSLGISDNPTALRTLSERDLKNLRPQIQALQRTQQQVDQAQQELADLSQNEQSLQLQLESTSTSGEQHGLPMDVQETSDLVANMRKRLQVEQRIEQAQAHMVEMEGQSHELLDEQVMPLWLFGLLLSVFILGSLMIGLWLIVPSSPLGQYGGLFALLGISGAGFSWMFKFFAEDAAADRLDACHRQIEIAEKQYQDGLREKEKLNSTLTLVDGSVVLRLQAAERHLATLENLLPVATERKVASHEASGARQRLQMAQQKYDQTLEEWKTKMVALGLPPELDHRLLTDVTDRYGKLSVLE